MKVSTTFVYLALLISHGVLNSCESSGVKSSSSAEIQENDSDDENVSDARTEKNKLSSGRFGGARKKGSVTYVMTTLANEDSFFGQLPQPKLEDVMRDLEAVLQKSSDDGAALISYLVFRRLSGASLDFLSVLSRRGSADASQDPWILIECSYSALLRNDFGMAQFLLDSASQQGKGNSKVLGAVLHARGLMFYRQRKTVLAMAAFREAAKLNYEPAMLTLSFFALRVGDAQGALVQLNKLNNMVSDDVNVLAALGIANRQAGKSDEAIAALNRVLKIQPSDKRVLWNTALAYADVPSKRKEAIALLERYSAAPGGLFEVDSKAQSLLRRLREQVDEERSKSASAASGSTTGGTQ